MDQSQKKQGNPSSGNSTEDINIKTQKERTFSVNLPSCYTAKDVLDAVCKNLGHAEIDSCQTELSRILDHNYEDDTWRKGFVRPGRLTYDK